MRIARKITTVASITAIAAVSACSSPGAEPTASAPTADVGGTVTVLTHDSFSLPDDVVAAFEAESGIDVEFVTAGDGGALVNQLILTNGAPLADVVYGVDNTFASRLADEDVLADYTSSAAPTATAFYESLPATPGLTAIDFSDVCLNVDLTYFADRGIEPPQSFQDLTDPQYANLTAVTNPATSSPGLAFLLATVAALGDGWQDFWRELTADGLRVAGSWSDAYFVDFSAPNYGGDRPIVLSYASSPPSEVIDGEPTTAALLDTCFRQVEYAGVLAGARNPAAGERVIDWMLSDDVQSALPTAMYVYPVSSTATVPDEWLEFAPLADTPWAMSPQEIDERRDDLVLEWTAVVLG